MTAHGYEMVCGNIVASDDCPFEDWYLDATFFAAETIADFRRESDVPLESARYLFRD